MTNLTTNPQKAESLTQSDEPVRILLIDDDEDEFFLTKDYLSEYGENAYSMEWEPNYDAALEKMVGTGYDVFLVDYRLGRHNGIELINQARSEGCEAPVIMLTGKGDQNIDKQSLRAGASDYLVKDQLNADLLERSIRYALERNEIQLAILEQEQKYRNLFEQSLDAILFTNENEYIRNSNASLVELLGYSQAELYNMQIQDLFADTQVYREWRKDMLEKEYVKDREIVFVDKSGSKVTVRLSSTQISNGQTKGVQAILHDISSLRKAEEDMRIAEQMSLTGKMSRMIAHEVRNPLTNINLALEEMVTEFSNNEEVQFYGEIIKRNSKRINELISKLLESSKISEVELELKDPHDVIYEVLRLCEDRLSLREIQTSHEFEQKKVLVKIDPEKIRIALINILTNAIEALEGVSDPQIKIQTTLTGTHLRLDIQDNGVGMDEESSSRLFQPFYTSKKTGMGLGMSSTKTILNKHNAEVEVKSELGEGTKFSIYFPVSQN